MTDRRTFVKESAIAAAAALALPHSLRVFSGQNSLFPFMGSQRLTVLHTNNLYQCPAFEQTVKHISRIRQREAHVLLVDAGNMFCGDRNRHAHVAALMQSAGYDAVLAGKKDYDCEPDYFEEHWQNVRVPLVVSNYSFDKTSLGRLHRPYKIVHKGALRIGIIGAGVDLRGLGPNELTNSIRYHDPVAQLSYLATKLKQDQKCQLVVCLSHLGLQNRNRIGDLDLAARSENIEIIVGCLTQATNATQRIVLNKNNSEVIVHHAGSDSTVPGQIEICFNDKGEKTGVEFTNGRFTG